MKPQEDGYPPETARTSGARTPAALAAVSVAAAAVAAAAGISGGVLAAISGRVLIGIPTNHNETVLG